MSQEPRVPAPKPAEQTGTWWRVLLSAMVLYVVGFVILAVTSNPNLFPTVVMIGSFMVPASFVAFFYERRHRSQLTMSRTLMGFFYGGLLGVFSASIVEPVFITGVNLTTFPLVGIIEELAKILGVLAIARRYRHDSEVDGIILGAAAGMGFAAMESTGYAFTAFMASGGSVTAAVAVTFLRGIMSPLGHGTWTAILAGVLFRESRQGHYRLNGAVLLAYLTVVILHALWDGLPLLMSAFLLTGLDVFVGQLIVGATGLAVLTKLWREANRLQDKQAANAEQTSSGGADAGRAAPPLSVEGHGEG